MSEICDEALASLYLYLDGEIDGLSAERIRRHLDDCPPCGHLFDFEERLQLVVKERLREEVPPALIERLHLALNQEPGSL
ncbi:MAG: zf-HC2 domain-containing protein [Acidimicrobiia bacterium]|jgi:mycothiol system anti-sigma-R factor